MLTLGDMRRLARGRISDATILIREGRFDTAMYICGYAVEVSLKASICRTLGWATFPNQPKEWQRYHAHLKVHDLQLLAKWSGKELELESPAYTLLWQEVREWNPEARYQMPGQATRAKALTFLRATRAVTVLLNPR